MATVRWAFQCSNWKPTAYEWTQLMASVQSEERDRVNKFVFQRDAKAALVSVAIIQLCKYDVYYSGSTPLKRSKNHELD